MIIQIEHPKAAALLCAFASKIAQGIRRAALDHLIVLHILKNVPMTTVVTYKVHAG